VLVPLVWLKTLLILLASGIIWYLLRLPTRREAP
jgi:hypothetical protein